MDPFLETLLENGVQPGKDPPKSVEPTGFAFFRLCADGYDDDIYEFVPFGVTRSGVCQLGELIGQKAYG